MSLFTLERLVMGYEQVRPCVGAERTSASLDGPEINCWNKRFDKGG
jgi:hypothetical protein